MSTILYVQGVCMSEGRGGGQWGIEGESGRFSQTPLIHFKFLSVCVCVCVCVCV